MGHFQFYLEISINCVFVSIGYFFVCFFYIIRCAAMFGSANKCLGPITVIYFWLPGYYYYYFKLSSNYCYCFNCWAITIIIHNFGFCWKPMACIETTSEEFLWDSLTYIERLSIYVRNFSKISEITNSEDNYELWVWLLSMIYREEFRLIWLVAPLYNLQHSKTENSI